MQSVAILKRILFVTDKFPWPLDDGGQIRSYQILKRLAKRFDVTLIAVSPGIRASEEVIEALGVEVVTFSRKQSARSTAWHLLRAVFTRRPYPL